MTLSDDTTVKDVGELLQANGWTLSVHSVPGRRLRAVLCADGAELGSAIHADFVLALQGAVVAATLSLSRTTP